jgi:hypothetical protein
MKHTLIVILAAASCAFAQDGPKGDFIYQTAGQGVVGTWASSKGPGTPIVGAPFSATITNESVQTLADGNRIVQTSTGTTARDSQGRTRQDAPLPLIGNLSPANAPHIVFLMDPVAQVSYTLNLTDSTAQKMPLPPGPLPGIGGAGALNVQIADRGGVSAAVPPGPLPPLPALPPPAMIATKFIGADDQDPARTEDLGSQTMEGVFVTGVRTTRTIPAGQIGNDKPIDIVTEVWMSPDLKTVVYSKRSDPRIGEQIFRLSNISVGEPDASLFVVPAGFRIVDGPRPIVFSTTQPGKP